LKTELVQKEKVVPLKPEEFVWMEVQDAGGSSRGETSSIRGLRDAADENYQWFCEHFMDCVIPSNDWKLQARKNPMSVYVSGTLEAFAVLVYKNGYRKWEQEFPNRQEDDETEASSLTTNSNNNRFLYTGDSKGSRKYEGWSAEGMKFYNEVFDLIGQQRRRRGCTFERNLLKKLASKPKSGGRSREANQAPRVKNNLDELMQMIGV
jgi:hypothetical protein